VYFLFLFCKNSFFFNEKGIIFIFFFPKAKSFQKYVLGIGDALSKYQKAPELFFKNHFKFYMDVIEIQFNKKYFHFCWF
jgi:hypothetical protein